MCVVSVRGSFCHTVLSYFHSLVTSLNVRSSYEWWSGCKITASELL